MRRGLAPTFVGAPHRARRRRGGRTCAFRCPSASPRGFDGRRVIDAAAARQISAGRSRFRRDAGDAPRHVRLVPRRGPAGRRSSTTNAAKRRRTITSCSRSRAARASSTTIRAASASWTSSRRRRSTAHPLFADIGVEPLGTTFDAGGAGRRARRLARAAEERRCSTSAASPASATSTSARRCTARGFRRCARRAASSAAEIAPARQARSAQVLEAAIEAGGSTLRDHRQTGRRRSAISSIPSPSTTAKARSAAIARCRGIISRTVQSGRSTFYCAICQIYLSFVPPSRLRGEPLSPPRHEGGFTKDTRITAPAPHR